MSLPSPPTIHHLPDEPFPGGSSPSDHGALPPWRKADLPEPLPFTWRNALKTIGPGAILLAGSIGGGEWIVGPMMTVKYGRGILWIATAAIVLQTLFNLEAVRYTLYTGEPILTGIMRLRPGSRVWSIFYILAGVAQLATPALALGCANVLFAAFTGDMPDSTGADSRTLLWISYAVLLLTVVLLLSGKSIERVLEKLSWAMIVWIFTFLVVVNVLVVSPENWSRTAKGFVTPAALPDNVDLMLLALFAATAGSGGLGNLAISNWFRDKGFGMGKHMGGIGGLLNKEHVELASVGYVFPTNETNLQRWRHWWRYAMLDQAGLWAIGCAVGMFLNVNLAASIVPPDAEISGYDAGAFQAHYLAAQIWQGLWALTLLNGFWILYSTHLGNTDCLTRTIADICWAAYPRLQRWSASRVYAVLLGFFTVWGLITLALGENALSLFKILGVIASPIMAVAAIQILRVNTRFLPPEIRPAWWRRIALIVCAMGYGGIAVALVLDFLRTAGVLSR